MLTILRKLLNRNPLRSMGETDRKVLAICMLAALAFWLILNLSGTYTIRRTVNLNYLLDPERTLARDTPVPTSQDVTITGPGWDLLWESLRFDALVVDIDVRGRNSLDLASGDLERRISRKLASGDLSVANLDFLRQTILTAPKEGKTVPVVSRIRTRFADGFVATDRPTFVPDSIVVTGPGDLLAALTAWPTEEITLEAVESDLRLNVGLAPPENSLEPSRQTVSFRLPVEAFIQRELDVPVTIVNPPSVDSFQVIPETVRLTVTLPQSSYYAVRPEDFSVVADLAEIRDFTDQNTVPLQLRRSPVATLSTIVQPRAVEFYVID